MVLKLYRTLDSSHKGCEVINKATLLDKFHLECDPELMINSNLISMKEIPDGNELNPEEVFEKINNSWIDISVSNLNTDPGYHLYRITMQDKSFGDLFILYFSYIIQDDNPKKSYIYMTEVE